MKQLFRSALSLSLYFIAIWLAYEVYGWTLPLIFLLFLTANKIERSIGITNILKGIEKNFDQIKNQINSKEDKKIN